MTLNQNNYFFVFLNKLIDFFKNFSKYIHENLKIVNLNPLKLNLSQLNLFDALKSFIIFAGYFLLAALVIISAGGLGLIFIILTMMFPYILSNLIAVLFNKLCNLRSSKKIYTKKSNYSAKH